MRTMDVHDALSLIFPTDAGFIPGERHGYYETVANDGVVETRRLWLFGLDGAPARELTGSFANPRGAQPSPSGGQLGFVADVDEIPRLCIANLASGAVEVMTQHPYAVSGPLAWSPSGRAILFAAASKPARNLAQPYRVTRHTFRHEYVGLIDDVVQDLYLLDLETTQLRQLTSDRSVNEDPRWSPDGTDILFRQSFRPDREWKGKPSAIILNLASGDRRVVVPESWGGVYDAEWCLGGQRIAFCGSPATGLHADVYFQKRDIWTVSVQDTSPECRTNDLPAGVGTWLEFDHPTFLSYAHARLFLDSSMQNAYVSAQRGGEVAIARVSLSGDEHIEFVIADNEAAFFLSDVNRTDESLLYVASTLLDPPDIFLRQGNIAKRVSDLNVDLTRGLTKPDVHKFTVTAPDGLALDGWAMTPSGEGPFPTVLCIHGGPSDAFGNVYMIDHQLLVGAGFAVVFSNFRGSGGYSNEFHQALHGRYGPLGEPDHLAAIDRAIELGIADPDRLGVYGLSHGGFATCWLAGRTNRFRAGVAENPLTNWASFYANVDAPWWIPLELGTTPQEDPTMAAELSPLTYAAQCTTPLLFIVGESDNRCSPFESEQFYRVLQGVGCETEMIRLPNSTHLGSWFGPIAARAAQNEALVDWFSRYLLERDIQQAADGLRARARDGA